MIARHLLTRLGPDVEREPARARDHPTRFEIRMRWARRQTFVALELNGQTGTDVFGPAIIARCRHR